ncbi:MAG TPA: phenylalanine--tRNA ligase subunit beta [Dehalococcoidia bacterium]|nr:phenylalanine--tRNA ligase subunit beta [Dehalococcoidia bacterium]
MKVPVRWLKDYVDIDLPPAELARRLTMAGTETSMMSLGQGWQGVVIGEIIAIEPHPDADRLRLVTVDLAAEKQTVVCGAPNLYWGDKIAFAAVGTELIDGHTGEKAVLKKVKIRGVVSCGMVCSEKELGISDSHEGIMVLPPEAPLGASLADFLGDVVLDLEVTPNRPDLLSVTGVAREVAALTGKSAYVSELELDYEGESIEKQISVEIADTDLCPRYCASLIAGIEIGESPELMKQHLASAGMRPINNIVDITNYVMLEYGQPLHGFDYNKIGDKKIIVRRARDGEVMISLDGVERKLSRDMLVIGDSRRAVAIGGVMGAANSEVDEKTTAILLEAASFKPSSIHFTSRKLGLVSEASMRFERAIRAELTLPALKRATQLIIQIAGGKAARGLIDVYPGRREPEPILLRPERVNKVLGVDFSPERIESALVALGFHMKKASSAEGLLVNTPYWRSDISIEEDLIEEVARIIGYDNIPTTILSGMIPPQSGNPAVKLRERVNDILTGFGFQEVITYSLTSREVMAKLSQGLLEPEPLPLANAMTVEQGCLRTSLRGNLLIALESNRRHENGTIMLYELGRIYLTLGSDLPEEPEILCGLLSGSGEDKIWHGRREAIGFFDAKGVVEGLLSRLGLGAEYEEGDDKGLMAGRQATITVGGERIGVVGELHPAVAEAFDITGEVYLFEMEMAALLPHTLGHKTFQPIPRFPAVVRDIALVLDNSISNKQVIDFIKGFSLVQEVALFDVYIGKQLPSGKKSLAYRINFQSSKHTMTDEEVDKVQQKILNKLSGELGVSLRV